MDHPGYSSDTTLILSDCDDANDSSGDLANTGSPSRNGSCAADTQRRDPSTRNCDDRQGNAFVLSEAIDESRADDAACESDAASHDFESDDFVDRVDPTVRLPSTCDVFRVNGAGESDADDSQPSEYGSDDEGESVEEDDEDDAAVESLLGSTRSEIGEPRSSSVEYDFVGRYATEDEAKRVRDLLDGFVYVYVHNFYSKKKIKTSGRRAPVQTADEALAWNPTQSLKRKGLTTSSTSYHCRSHVSCGHYMLITVFNTTPPVYELAQKGQHGVIETDAARYGIDCIYKHRVESLVLQNYLPSAIHSMLLQECAEARGDFNLVPEVKQIQNMRSNKRRRLVYTVENFNDVLVWVLVTCGTVGVVYDHNKHEYHHRFFPWAYMFVLTENEFAYTKLFSTVKECARKFLEISVDVRYGSLDHAEPIANAFKNVWPEITLLSCWPHLTRAVKKHARSLNISADFYNETIKDDLNLLHNARNETQFDALAKAVLCDWRARGASSFADYFEAVYLTPKWRRWFITASGTPGVVPRQQAIEAHNKSIKAAISDILRSDTARVLKEAFPRILLADGSSPRTNGEPIRLYCVGTTPRAMIKKAQWLQVKIKSDTTNVLEVPNHYIYRNGPRNQGDIDSIVLNSRKTMVLPVGSNYAVDDATPDPVTTKRANVFLRSLDGRVRNMDVNTMYSALATLHQVKVLHQDPLPPFPLATRWTHDQITRVRNKLRCDCCTHFETGWLCSHIPLQFWGSLTWAHSAKSSRQSALEDGLHQYQAP